MSGEVIALPGWVYEMVILALKRQDAEALKVVPYDVQYAAQAIADSRGVKP